MLQIADQWKDYELIDAAEGEKLERWGNVVLRRPDGQVIWPMVANESLWNKADAVYHRSDTGGGNWSFKTKIPDDWTISYKNLKFKVTPTGFKHTGLFPEQAVNWEFMTSFLSSRTRSGISPKILNLFAYTGAASVVCASAGAEVVHVDASKGMNEWAKTNAELNHVENKIRFITDDVKKFVEREIRRGNKYDGIIMDPPVYGRGPKGELWEIEKEIGNLIEKTSQLLSKEASFLIVNTYTSSFSQIALQNILEIVITRKIGGKVETGEIGLQTSETNLILPCGIVGRWTR